MITKHTPGPWTLKSDPFHFDTLSSIVGGATKGDGTRFPSHELHVEIGGFADFRIQEANARLIAAAPELLDAPIVAHECGRPSRVSLYDEEGIEGWRWTHPDGREWEQVGSWDESEPMHPLVAAAIAKATEEDAP